MTYDTTIAVINGFLYGIGAVLLALGIFNLVKKKYLDATQTICWAIISFCFAHM